MSKTTDKQEIELFERCTDTEFMLCRKSILEQLKLQQVEIKELKKEKYRLQKALNQAEDYLDIAKAEIERLRYNCECRLKNVKSTKAEAIKEFAERLKADINKTWYYELENDIHNARALKRVDELVKEMVGADNDT